MDRKEVSALIVRLREEKHTWTQVVEFLTYQGWPVTKARAKVLMNQPEQRNGALTRGIKALQDNGFVLKDTLSCDPSIVRKIRRLPDVGTKTLQYLRLEAVKQGYSTVCSTCGTVLHIPPE